MSVGFLSWWDGWISLGGLFSGAIVGLTGLGGAAIVTPMLVLIFGIPAPIAVSTDVVSAAAIKPIGAGVHLKRRTPYLAVAGWLTMGSVPGVLLGTWFFTMLSAAELKRMIGVVLIVAVAVTLIRTRLSSRAGHVTSNDIPRSRLRAGLTFGVGLTVGILVGMTSVGSGTLIAAALLILYPAMRPNRLVGTDLLQAVPMLLVGAIAHWGIGEVDWAVVGSLLVGQIPGVFIGARVSSRYEGKELKWLLLVIIAGAALALLGMPTWIATTVVVVGTLVLGSAIVVKHRRDIKLTSGPRPDPPDAEPANTATVNSGAGAEPDEPVSNSAGTPDPR